MILTDRTMTVNGNTASLDSNVYLYRGDKNVEINFNIVNSKFRFTKKSADNIIESSEAFYSIVKLIAPNGAEIEFPATDIEDGKAKWLIEGELIDELDEVGTYNIQIRLLNNEKDSIITMPPVYGQVEVSEPLFMDDTAITGVSKTTVSKTSFLSSTQRDTLNPDGTYNKKTWESKELIYESDLNTLEDIASKNRQSIINNEKEIATLKSKTSALETTTSSHTSTLSTHTSQIADLQKEVGQTSESVEGSYITVSGSKDGSITDIEILGNTVQNSSNLADIQSVGTLREDGLYEMSILSSNSVYNGYSEKGTVSTSDGSEITNDLRKRTKFIKVKPSTTYTIIKKESGFDLFGCEYNSSKSKVGSNISIPLGTQIYSITTSSNTNFLRLRNNDNQSFDFVIFEGTKATYEPYQENKTSILLPCQLEKVGDVSDRLFRREDGVWCVEKNIVTKVLKGVDCSYASSTLANTIYGRFILDNMKLMSEVVCDKLVWQTYSASNDTEYCYSWNSDKNNFYINILKSKATDLNSMRTYLNSNPYTVKYITKTPQIIELPLDTQIQLNSFLGTTNIFTENTVIESTIKCTIPKSLGASVQSLNNKTDILSDRIEKVETLQEGSELEVTTEKGYVVCENTNNGQVEDLKVEGKTLVNLADKTQYTATVEGWKTYLGNLQLYKPNTTYTFIGDVTTLADGVNLYVKSKALKKGYNKVLFTLDDVITSIIIYSVGSPASFVIDNVVILEGDHTQNPPSYFEGLKSVGDGVDKIEVLSQNNANLINEFDFVDIQKASIENGKVVLDNSKLGTMRAGIAHKVYLKQGCSYMYSFKNASDLTLLNMAVIVTSLDNVNGSVAGLTVGKVYTHTIASGYYYLRTTSVNTKNGKVSFNISFSLGSSAKDYTSYKGNKKQILYQNSDGVYEKPALRSTGSVSDTIEKHSDGKYYFHKRCGEVVLNGSENISLIRTQTNTMGFEVLNISGLKAGGSVLSDKFTKLINTEDSEGLRAVGDSNKFLIHILKSKLTSQDITGFKTWLQSNTVTVVYQLATEEVYECVNLDLDSYEGETSVIFDGGAISPKLSFKIASHIANTIQVLKDRINYLENKVIGMFKAVLSGDVQTLAYELYPEDFENKE